MRRAQNRSLSLADPREIARFDALASDWWNPEGPMKPLHRLNPARLRFLRRELGAHFAADPAAIRPFSGLRMLDIGCGAGLIAEPMTRLGFGVTGIDLAQETIGIAKAHAEAAGLAIDYEAIGIEDLPQDPTFDAISLLEILEHVPNPGKLMRQAAMRLKPGGILIASTINRTLKAYALAILGAEYVLRWLPCGTHDWDKFVTPAEMAEFFRAAGLEPGARAGLVFDPLANTWLLARDCEVNYIFVATKAS